MRIDLEQFHSIVLDFNQNFPGPDNLSKLIDLRIELIREEFDEFLAEVLGLDNKPNLNFDKEKAGKELADLLFVVLGAFDELELDLEASLAHVGLKNFNKITHKDLMTKREDGKVVKPLHDERFA